MRVGGRLDPITSGIPAKITFAVTAVSRLSTQQMLRFYSPSCTPGRGSHRSSLGACSTRLLCRPCKRGDVTSAVRSRGNGEEKGEKGVGHWLNESVKVKTVSTP